MLADTKISEQNLSEITLTADGERIAHGGAPLLSQLSLSLQVLLN